MSSPHKHLIWLTLRRSLFRLRRAANRMRSPRRVVASAIAVIFLCAYVLNGFLILASRRTADPESLRLWLSGGMVLYLIYHAVRCVWTDKQVDMEYTAAENLWLGGAPLKRSTVAAYKVNTVFFSALLKTFFLVIALTPDVRHAGLLATGVFAALVLLETVRMIWQRFVSGLSRRHLVVGDCVRSDHSVLWPTGRDHARRLPAWGLCAEQFSRDWTNRILRHSPMAGDRLASRSLAGNDGRYHHTHSGPNAGIGDAGAVRHPGPGPCRRLGREINTGSRTSTFALG